ncbi:MAG: MGMT family protein [Clostridia bacterium]|nr:MGMT family protein [Clostridia bacterium]
MTDFYKRVYQIVKQIPKGSVATYGQIAALLGNPLASRVVGDAMRKAPAFLSLPCHRVVNQKGQLAPGYAFGGEGQQRQLLQEEGITFLESGCIDMKRHLWRIR